MSLSLSLSLIVGLNHCRFGYLTFLTPGELANLTALSASLLFCFPTF